MSICKWENKEKFSKHARYSWFTVAVRAAWAGVPVPLHCSAILLMKVPVNFCRLAACKHIKLCPFSVAEDGFTSFTVIRIGCPAVDTLPVR